MTAWTKKENQQRFAGRLTIMGLAVGFSTPALGLEGMVLCSAATVIQQQPLSHGAMSMDLG